MCILLKDGETEIVEKTIKKKKRLAPFSAFFVFGVGVWKTKNITEP